MKAWKERLHNEREELMGKYQKLVHFLQTAHLDKENMDLLYAQREAMYEYLAILDKRIAINSKGR